MARSRRSRKPAPVASTEVTGFYVKVPVPKEVLDIGTRVNTIITEAVDVADDLGTLLKKAKKLWG